MSTAAQKVAPWIEKQPEAMRAVLAQKAHIANILPIGWIVSRTYATFQILACPEGEDFSVTEISAYNSVIDLGDKRTMDQPMLATDIAADLVKYCNSDAGDGSDLGVFLCGPNGPTRQQLQEANARVDAFCERLVAAADRDYDRSHSTLFITDLQRMAAKRLHLEREWSGAIRTMIPCEGCGTNILPTVAVCKTCGAILDRDKAERLGLVEPRERSERKPKIDSKTPTQD